MYIRVTSLEQLSLAEFSGEYARSKVYENDHKNVLGIWLDLVSNAKYFQSHFFVSKIGQIFLIVFSLKHIIMGDQLLLMTYFDTFDF